MSAEDLSTGDSLSRKESIPVCTLFNDGTTENEDAFKNIQSPVTEPTLDKKDEVAMAHGERKSSEPSLCNVFTDNTPSPGGDDIFSKISTDDNTKSDVSRGMELSIPAMETLRLNRSVDSLVVEDLIESDTNSENLPTTEQKSDPEAPDPSACMTKKQMELSSSDWSHSEETGLSRNPVIATPSFISVTDFSITTDDHTSYSYDQSFTSETIDETTTEMDGLSIEDVKSELASGTSFSTEIQSSDLPEESFPSTSVESMDEHASSVIEATTTQGLFSTQPDNQQSALFGIGNAGEADEEDPFAAALSNSALDRRRDAWIPSDETREVLMSCTVNQKAPDLEMEKITRPGLSTSEILEDPVKNLVTKLTGSEVVVKRENLTMEDVTQDKIGVQKLMESGNHRSAANLCTKLLASHGQGFGQATHMTTNTPETLWLWYSRIYNLTKLKLYDAATAELSAFKDLDNPDLFFEFYPNVYPGRRGSMVPFQFRLLHAEFPRYVDNPRESLVRLQKILGVCVKILENLKKGNTEMGEGTVLNANDIEESIKFWTERQIHVIYCIGNTLVHLKDYTLAVEIYDKVLKMKPEDTVILQSGIGRLYLHVGDIRSAKERFTAAEQEAGTQPEYKVQLLLNRGFMYIGTNNWKEAYTQFETALNTEPTNVTALNNKAVCLLYLGRLKDAIALLESGTVQQTGMDVMSKVADINRQNVLMEGLLSNLSTLYELESSKCVIKKRALFLKHVAPSVGDSFNTACFKEI